MTCLFAWGQQVECLQNALHRLLSLWGQEGLVGVEPLDQLHGGQLGQAGQQRHALLQALHGEVRQTQGRTLLRQQGVAKWEGKNYLRRNKINEFSFRTSSWISFFFLDTGTCNEKITVFIFY